MWETKTLTRWSINTLRGFKMLCKSCFAWAVFRQKRGESTGKRRVYGFKKWFTGSREWCKEIVTVIAQREEYKDQATPYKFDRPQ